MGVPRVAFGMRWRRVTPSPLAHAMHPSARARRTLVTRAREKGGGLVDALYGAGARDAWVGTRACTACAGAHAAGRGRAAPAIAGMRPR